MTKQGRWTVTSRDGTHHSFLDAMIGIKDDWVIVEKIPEAGHPMLPPPQPEPVAYFFRPRAVKLNA